jgi:hypothetical protein
MQLLALTPHCKGASLDFCVGNGPLLALFLVDVRAALTSPAPCIAHSAIITC